MFCSNCGKELYDNDKFCTNCGTAVNGVDNTKPVDNKKTKIAVITAIFASLCVVILAVLVLIMWNTNKKANKAAQDSNVTQEEVADSDQSQLSTGEETSDNTEVAMEESSNAGKEEAQVTSLDRPVMLSDNPDEADIRAIIPKVPEYKVNSDFSNVINSEDFTYRPEEFKEKLVEDGFVVVDGGGNEFFEIYEFNRYSQSPNFVTVDSMMHTYHIYFSYLLKSIEKKSLSDALTELTEEMLAESINQADTLNGTQWEDAANRNVAFFSVASRLLTGNEDYPSYVKDKVDEEYALIKAAQTVEISPIFGNYEDYSQYTPRGYYDGDSQLEKYFRAMMWYGRMQFSQENEDMNRSALLITLALNDTGADKWKSIYSVTSFFAGASDDLGYYDYMPAIETVYGDGIQVSDLIEKKAEWNDFNAAIEKMPAPRINSIVIDDGDDNVIKGYRFMGQRFSIDATIMQELIYSRVGESTDSYKRMLPDVIDVPAALGSQKANELLEQSGATSLKNFQENLKKMQAEFNNEDNQLWKASLYAGWLHTLRPILEEKGEGYPKFMQSDKWAEKSLESFAGSYTELKHDTVLYSKQIMAEMGGGWEEDVDTRGYVEPEPLVFSRFALLAEDTAKGLESYGYLSEDDKDNLSKLAELSRKLQVIAVKELNDELCTDEEYALIDDFGGQIEHFWIDVMRKQTGEEYPSTQEYPAALVVDIATDPNGSVLEAGTGNPAEMYVAVMVDGKIRIASGAVYSFYEFEHPLSDRLTDTKWRQKLGIEMIDDNYTFNRDKSLRHPDWAYDYRYEYVYDYDY